MKIHHEIPRRKTGVKGFTLVELLVVLGILLVLVALLFPSLQVARRSGLTSACANNLRELGMASASYVNDNNQKLVAIYDGVRVWRLVLLPYLTNGERVPKTFICPADKIALSDPRFGNAGTCPASYAINEAGDRLPGTTSRDRLFEYPGYFLPSKKMFSIRRPSSTIFICDIGKPSNPSSPPKEWIEAGRVAGAANFGYARFPNEAAFNGSDAWNIFPRHGGNRVNVLFYDGHVATLDIQREIIDHPPGDPDCVYDNN